MSKTGWTEVQLKRLKELGADGETMSALFDTNEQRDRCYQASE
jgi:hypothetical protein